MFCLKIGILSRNARIYSTHRLVKAALSRGHEVQVVNPLSCYMNITSAKPMVHLRDQQLNKFDAIIPRIGASITFYGTAIRLPPRGSPATVPARRVAWPGGSTTAPGPPSSARSC